MRGGRRVTPRPTASRSSRWCPSRSHSSGPKSHPRRQPFAQLQDEVTEERQVVLVSARDLIATPNVRTPSALSTGLVVVS